MMIRKRKHTMTILGITGSIGMGKSTVDAMLRFMGIPVQDADATVRDLLRQRDVIALVERRFPEVINNRAVDRQILATSVFTDQDALRDLEAILHPLVMKEQKAFLYCQRCQRRHLVALDIPLLFETHADARVDVTMVVTAAGFIQRSRVLGRPHMSAERFQAICDAQLCDKKKRHLADFVINTGAGRRIVWCQLHKAIRTISTHGTKRKKHARNCSRH